MWQRMLQIIWQSQSLLRSLNIDWASSILLHAKYWGEAQVNYQEGFQDVLGVNNFHQGVKANRWSLLMLAHVMDAKGWRNKVWKRLQNLRRLFGTQSGAWAISAIERCFSLKLVRYSDSRAVRVDPIHFRMRFPWVLIIFRFPISYMIALKSYITVRVFLNEC